MKKNLIYCIIVSITILFISCDGNDPSLTDYSRIIAVVNDGNTFNNQIDSVYAAIYYEEVDTNNYLLTKSEIIAKSKFQNGSFTLQLTPLSNNKLFCAIDKIFTDSVTISDKSAKVNFINLRCMSYGYKIGDMFLHNAVNRLDSGYVECEYVYCDKAVSITGATKVKNDYTFVTHYYDIYFKKGWNIMTTKLRSNGIEIRYNITSNNVPTDVKWYPSIIPFRELSGKN